MKVMFYVNRKGINIVNMKKNIGWEIWWFGIAKKDDKERK